MQKHFNCITRTITKHPPVNTHATSLQLEPFRSYRNGDRNVTEYDVRKPGSQHSHVGVEHGRDTVCLHVWWCDAVLAVSCPVMLCGGGGGDGSGGDALCCAAVWGVGRLGNEEVCLLWSRKCNVAWYTLELRSFSTEFFVYLALPRLMKREISYHRLCVVFVFVFSYETNYKCLDYLECYFYLPLWWSVLT